MLSCSYDKKRQIHLPIICWPYIYVRTEFFVRKGVSIINDERKNGISQYLWLAYAVSLLYAADKKS